MIFLVSPYKSPHSRRRPRAFFCPALWGQYLDMAAYNNNFSPAKDDPAGSTKELVRSYFEMPLDELVLATKALDSLIQLGKEVLEVLRCSGTGN